MSEKKNKNINIPKRKTPPIYPSYFTCGISPSENIAIIDIMDSQSNESNVSIFSFIITRKKAEILKEYIDDFLNMDNSSDD